MSLNDCGLMASCEFRVGHKGPCSYKIVECGDTEFVMIAWSSFDPMRKAEEQEMLDLGWKRYAVCIQSGGSMVVFERPKV